MPIWEAIHKTFTGKDFATNGVAQRFCKEKKTNNHEKEKEQTIMCANADMCAIIVQFIVLFGQDMLIKHFYVDTYFEDCISFENF